jgi:hypothetical protein
LTILNRVYKDRIVNDISAEKNPQECGTNLRNFMTNRGAIIIKETRPIGAVDGEYGASLEVETMMLRIVRGAEQNDAFGVVLTIKNQRNDSAEKVHLDFDEIEELVNALGVIRNTAEEIGRTKTDYTEVIYATKDNARFGFFQGDSQQMGFVNIGYNGQMFQQVYDNERIERLLRSAVEHLRSKGAEIVRN